MNHTTFTAEPEQIGAPEVSDEAMEAAVQNDALRAVMMFCTGISRPV